MTRTETGAPSRTHGGVLVLALIAALLVPSFAQARPAKITGKLSAPRYTVIAMTASGEVKTSRTRHGKFKLRPPSRSVTLQLRAPDATYGGPIVVATQAQGAILGVRAGAKLGKVRVDAGDGYATLARRLPRKYVDTGLSANAENGVPIGAGNLGRVFVSSPSGPSSDLDLDGVPAPLDVDDDGDVILDPFDRLSGGRAAYAAEPAVDVVVTGRSVLNLDLPETVNANAPGLTDQQIEEALPSFGNLILGTLGIDASEPGKPSVELDCGDPDTGLSYCREHGSTGTLADMYPVPRPGDPGDRFPGCCDPDGDGFGSLAWTVVPQLGALDAHAVPLLHGATSDQVRAGDLLIARANDGAHGTFAGAVSYVFQTVPALVSYTDENGNSRTISYPVTPGSPGTRENPFIVSDGPDADPTPPGASGPIPEIEVTLTFWRPQRKALPEEPGEWIDVGHTVYVAGGRGIDQDASSYPGGGCRPSAYSETDPDLAPTQAPDSPLWFNSVFGLEDSSDDQPASPANTFTFTLNLSHCFGSFFSQQDDPMGLFLRAQPANPLIGPPDNARATVAWFRPG